MALSHQYSCHTHTTRNQPRTKSFRIQPLLLTEEMPIPAGSLHALDVQQVVGQASLAGSSAGCDSTWLGCCTCPCSGRPGRCDRAAQPRCHATCARSWRGRVAGAQLRVSCRPVSVEALRQLPPGAGQGDSGGRAAGFPPEAASGRRHRPGSQRRGCAPGRRSPVAQLRRGRLPHLAG